MKNIKKKKAESASFNEVEIREPLIEDLIAAERVAGTDQGIKYALAVLSQIATFDGKSLVPEDLKRLSVKDFFGLVKAVGGFGLEELAKELLPSQGKEDSA
jgi:hypothetical protein